MIYIKKTQRVCKKKAVCLLAGLLIWLASASSVYAYNLESLLPGITEQDLVKIRAGVMLKYDSQKGASATYYPHIPLVENYVEMAESIETGFFVESLFLIAVPENFKKLEQDEKLLKIVNSLRKVSTQEGITYISHRKGDKPAVLINKSYHVGKVGSKKSLDDPVLETLPCTIRDIIYQADTSFFGNYYEYNYTIQSDAVLVDFKNLTTLSVFGLIPAVKKETFSTILSIIPTDEGLLCYSIASIKDRTPEVNILGLKVHLPSAIQRRVVAMQEWFAGEVVQ